MNDKVHRNKTAKLIIGKPICGTCRVNHVYKPLDARASKASAARVVLRAAPTDDDRRAPVAELEGHGAAVSALTSMWQRHDREHAAAAAKMVALDKDCTCLSSRSS